MTDRSPSPIPNILPPTQIRYSGRPKYPDPTQIFADAILLTEGRDKVVKLLQYTSRLILLLSTTHAKRLKPFISQMSMTRKVLKLGHGILPYGELKRKGLRGYDLIRAVVEFLNDFWDDVYCLSRIGLLRGPRLQLWSETWANRAWMMGIIMDLQVLMQKRTKLATRSKNVPGLFLSVPGLQEKADNDLSLEKLRAEVFWIDVSILKLLADLAFCCTSCRLFR